MIRLLFVLAVVFQGAQTSFGQSPELDRLKTEVGFYTDIMVNAEKADHRLRAHDQMISLLDTFLNTAGSYDSGLDSIPWLAVVKGDDFRIITWQLRVTDDEYKYGGRMQWRDHVESLRDTRPFFNGANRTTFSPAAWYGCLYYEIIPFEQGKVRYYMLLGFNAENKLLNTKVAEVLDMTSGQPVFGLPVFITRDDALSRVIYTYADASAAHLAYDAELNAIVHDHLINLPGVGPEGEALPVSDGSLEAWIFKKGNWIYEEEVYDVKVKDPPMTDERKDRKEDKDILGRPKKE